MEKRNVLALMAVVLVMASITSVVAVDTKIKVTTYADHNLNINFLKASPPIELLETFNFESGATGEYEFTFATEYETFDADVFVLEGNTKVAHEKFEDLDSGVPVEFKVYTQGSEFILNYDTLVDEENETQEDNETQENESTEIMDTVAEEQVQEELLEESQEAQEETAQPSPITGQVTSEGSGIFSQNWMFFVFGLAIFIGAVIFVSAMKMKTARKMHYGDDDEDKKNIKVKKLSEKLKEIKEDKKEKIDGYEKAIEEAEDKIKEAQKEIDKLKNASKVDELKKRIEEDKKELEKLSKDD